MLFFRKLFMTEREKIAYALEAERNSGRHSSNTNPFLTAAEEIIRQNICEDDEIPAVLKGCITLVYASDDANGYYTTRRFKENSNGELRLSKHEISQLIKETSYEKAKDEVSERIRLAISLSQEEYRKQNKENKNQYEVRKEIYLELFKHVAAIVASSEAGFDGLKEFWVADLAECEEVKYKVNKIESGELKDVSADSFGDSNSYHQKEDGKEKEKEYPGGPKLF